MKSYSSNDKSEGMNSYIAGHCNLDTNITLILLIQI